LTRERVVAAALAILDRDGPDGLTMRALGRDLGVDPMAAYHHVPNKAAILDGVVEAVWREVSIPPTDDVSWQRWLRELGDSLRRTLVSHANALPIVATRTNLSRPGFDLAEAALSVLRRAGFPPQEAALALNALGQFVLGSALAEVGLPGESDDDVSDERFSTAFEAAGGADRYPSLAEGLGLNVDFDPAQAWELGNEALIRGLESRLREPRE